jgi:hypothetical protein
MESGCKLYRQCPHVHGLKLDPEPAVENDGRRAFISLRLLPVRRGVSSVFPAHVRHVAQIFKHW